MECAESRHLDDDGDWVGAIGVRRCWRPKARPGFSGLAPLGGADVRGVGRTASCFSRDPGGLAQLPTSRKGGGQ